MQIGDLPQCLLRELLGRLDAPELCTLASTCRKLNEVARKDLGEGYWQNLCETQYGLTVDGVQQARRGTATWKELYQERFLESKRNRQRAKHRKLIAIQNERNDVQREVDILSNEARDLSKQERAELSLLSELNKSRRADVALKTWSPVSVSVWHKKVVEQSPINVEKRIQELEAKVEVTRLLLKGVLKRLHVKRRRLESFEGLAI